jgi:hypothetical protein
MHIPESTIEHQWLLQLVGEWEFDTECNMGPDQPASKSSGRQSTRALGSLWTIGDMEGPGPGDEPMRSLITIGFDPSRNSFVGSFIASCMTYQWLYTGSLDATHRILTLDAEGPSFSGDGSMAKYQDIIELVDSNTYLFSSQYQDAEGNWFKFMHSKYTRK